jgi:hypothetical protein
MIGAKRLAGRLDDLHAADPPYAADVLDAVAASVRHVHRTLPGAIERYVDSSGSSPAS